MVVPVPEEAAALIANGVVHTESELDLHSRAWSSGSPENW